MSHALIIAGKATTIVGKWLARLPHRNDEAFAKAKQTLFEDWTIEVHLRTQEQYEDLSAHIADIDAKIARLSDSMTHALIYANYARAADAEPTPERRLMLAFAAAALIDMRLTAAQHSRVERLVRELDPDDVRSLNVIDRSRGAVRGGVWQDSPSADILAASACLRVTHKSAGAQWGAGPGHDEVTITREGCMVLQVLRLYLRTSEPAQAATGP